MQLKANSLSHSNKPIDICLFRIVVKEIGLKEIQPLQTLKKGFSRDSLFLIKSSFFNYSNKNLS